MTDPVDVDNLPPTQYLMLEVLAARHRLGHHEWSFPSSQRPAAERLAHLGLVTIGSWPAPKTISVALTDAGRAVMLRDGYTPPILEQQQQPSAPLDLRALAVILARGQDAARDMGDPGLAQALWFMTEQTVALHHGPTHIIGNLDEEFAQVNARYQ